MSKAIPLKVLIVEDSPADADLVLRQLRLAGYDPTWTRVDTADEFTIKLRDKPEIVLDGTNQLTVLGSTVSTDAPAVTQPTNAPPPAMQSTNFPEIMSLAE